MRKFVLISITAVMIIVPILAGRISSARLGLQKALIWCLVGIIAYVLAVLLIYPRLNP